MHLLLLQLPSLQPSLIFILLNANILVLIDLINIRQTPGIKISYMTFITTKIIPVSRNTFGDKFSLFWF